MSPLFGPRLQQSDCNAREITAGLAAAGPQTHLVYEEAPSALHVACPPRSVVHTAA